VKTGRAELVYLGGALTILVMLALPRRFATRDPDSERIVDTVDVSLGLQTGEGLLASAVALALAALCAGSLLRGQLLRPAALAGAAVVVALGVPGLADLMADMPGVARSDGVFCVDDPAEHFEADLGEHLRGPGEDYACATSTRTGFFGHALSWLMALVLAAGLAGLAFRRTDPRRKTRVAGAIAAPAVMIVVLLLVSMAMNPERIP